MVRGDLQNKEIVGDNWSPTASISTMKHFLVVAAKHKARVHQFDFIGVLLQEKVKNKVFVKLDSRYVDFFLEYLNLFGISLKLLKSVYGMTNSGNLFADELTEWLLEAGFIQSQCQMSIYYKCAPYGTKQLSYLMFITVSIGILLNLLENGLWVL